MAIKTVSELDIAGRRLFIRVDFNVPLTPAGGVADDTRIRESLPTIKYALEKGARVVLASHLGRPKGKPDKKFTLEPVGVRLAELLGIDVTLTDEPVGDGARKVVNDLRPGGVALLENLRFSPLEEANDEGFSRALASYADVYVNDAFGTAHRAHASTAGVARDLPAVAGFLMEKEIDFLGRVVGDAERPLAAIIGGAKISSKIGVLRHLLSKVDVLLVGGGMASTFLKAQGVDVGASVVEDGELEHAREIVAEAGRRKVQLGLPVDAVVADRFAADAASRIVELDAIPKGWMILDVGPRTVQAYEAALGPVKTVVWNGPLGVAEWDAFAQGSNEIARFLAKSGATVVIGGGETVALVTELGLVPSYAHVSTGGGASLEFLEGRELPGVDALQNR
jgi:phosphoglycerate kinase